MIKHTGQTSSDWHQPPARSASWRILVADDNELTRKLLVHLLEIRGHRVETATNGREVLELLPRGKFDLVLMDVEMPELNGLETTATIRAVETEEEKLFCALSEEIQDDWNEFPRRLPILAMTAHNGESHIAECLDSGMDAYLKKPVQAGELFAAVEDLMTWSILENRARRDMLREQELEKIVHRIHNPVEIPPPHLLVIEDNRVNQTLVRRTLEKAGYRVTVAENGEAGLDVFQSQYVDAIIMDIQMPVLDGLQTTRLIRSQERNRHTPIIALTSAYKLIRLEECEQAGMTRCLKKPIHPKELLAVVHEFCPIQKKPIAGPHTALSRSPQAESYFNGEQVASEMGYEPELLAELIALLLQDLPGQIQDLEESLEDHNRLIVLAVSHTIKGAISSFTTRRPFELIARIHDLAELSEMDEAARLFTDFTLALKQLVGELLQFSQKVAAGA